MPEVPTLNEAGAKGYDANSWQMMVGPARMPEPIMAKLNKTLAEFMLTPDTQRHFTSLGMQPLTGTPEQARTYIDAEAKRWTAVIKGMGISVD